MKLLLKAKKSLGQNFLIDKNIIKKIIEIGNINKNKIIMEIGSGYGDLTKNIVAMGPKKIFAIEKDKKLSFLLKKKFQDYKNIKIINGDILNIIQENNLDDNVTIFGNLPYNISTKILASLIMLKKWPPWYHVLILMFQKEVADRIIAKTQTKEFGRLSILANWRLEIKKHFDISKNCFFPKPKINSTLLSFKPKKINTFNLKNPKNLEIVTRILFSNRRKMINKNLNKLFKEKLSMVKNLNIDLSKRPEELSNETFYKIAIQYEKLFD
jgi:16S rRNA (adenine1518-N6/adenine1519-N6)-dimethyltransferase